MAKTESSADYLDIDHYLNRFIPLPHFRYLPRPISHFLGYRAPFCATGYPTKLSPSISARRSVLLVWLFSFLGAFIGIAILENVYLALPTLNGNSVPIIIASFGAGAVLEYNTIESPLAQPRNLVLGQIISAAIGIGITKLFHLLPDTRFEQLRWLAGALSVGAASSIMAITKTVHPPAGATALIAATTAEFTELGWWFLPLVMLGCALMLVSALLVNNLYKRFPIYWWTPVDLAQFRDREDIVRVGTDIREDVEKGMTGSMGSDNAGLEKNEEEEGEAGNADERAKSKSGSSESDVRTGVVVDNMKTRTRSEILRSRSRPDDNEILICADKIMIPNWMELSDWEKDALEIVQNRLQRRARGETDVPA